MPPLFPIVEKRQWGFMRRDGSEVTRPCYLDAEDPSEGLARVKTRTGHGFVDDNGDVVISPRFAQVGRFREGLCKALKGKDGRAPRWGFIDRSGAFVVEPRFLQVEPFSCGRAAAQDPESKCWGYIDTGGSFVVPPRLTSGWNRYGEDVAGVPDVDTGLTGYLDRDGGWAIPPRLELGDPFAEGLARVLLGGAGAFIDHTGAVVIGGLEREDGDAEPNTFSDGLARARVGGRHGWVDRSGALAIRPQFAWTGRFYEGRAMAAVRSTTEQGVIDRDGNFVVRPELWGVCDFRDGLARVYPDGRRPRAFGYIDRDGGWVWRPSKGFGARFADLR